MGTEQKASRKARGNPLPRTGFSPFGISQLCVTAFARAVFLKTLLSYQ